MWTTPARSSAVHRPARGLHTPTRLSSTACGTVRALAFTGARATLSPVSTDAKTMDETLNYMMDNDKSDHQVDCVDGPTATSTAADAASNGVTT